VKATQTRGSEGPLTLKSAPGVLTDQSAPSVLVDLLDDGDVLLTRREAARYLRTTTRTLERWAAAGTGPKETRMGPMRAVTYTLRNLRAFARGGSG
jgi:hypothetical protein